ncbi:MAG: hypothetical protein M1828_003214 [Chrysothrix sp. TS-e1954]|nr:MAG: hypothetical protein M1828_003214 [Chrysothrix sp. TS-e1954]
MAFASSPVTYPPTSSPHAPSPRKRRKLEVQEQRQPLHPSTDDGNACRKTIAGFVIDHDSDDEISDHLVVQEKRKQPTTHIHPVVSENDIRTQIPLVDTNDWCEAKPDEQHIEDSYQKASSHEQSSPCSVLAASGTNGHAFSISRRALRPTDHYSTLVASRSTTTSSGARTSYYGIDIHAIIDEANAKSSNDRIAAEALETAVLPSVEKIEATEKSGRKQQLWTEKYRARKFTDLIGDERTHRSVLRWLKAWDPIVFPSSRSRPKPTLKHQSSSSFSSSFQNSNDYPEKPHRKILLLTGSPGLGKTTLAHVCAKQAGYEIKEINASDERSRDIVKGRIRDMVGTENVRPAGPRKDVEKTRNVTKPVCIVVDEVDGVTSGSGAGGGEGGFIKALLDLLALDHKNSNKVHTNTHLPASSTTTQKKKGDPFRLLRPIILIANDIYHPSLRLLRSNNSTSAHHLSAEIIHVRAPPISLIIPRLQLIFEKEGIPADADGVRTLCESAWGISSHKERRTTGAQGAGEGDIRGILVVGEWVARKFRNAQLDNGARPGARLTRKWLEAHILSDLAHGGGGARGIGRGNSREVAERVFLHNAGFPAPPPAPPSATTTTSTSRASTQNSSASCVGQHSTHTRLREIIKSTGEDDRIASDVFSAYPLHPYSDDLILSKPNAAHDWLHFHDLLSRNVHTQQAWELAPYLSYPILACHSLFASQKSTSLSHRPSAYGNKQHDGAHSDEEKQQHPLHGPTAAHHSIELLKSNTFTLTSFQQSLSLPLQRSFLSTSSLVTELIPYLTRLLVPDIQPVVVGGSDKGVASVRRAEERERVRRGVDAMVACGVSFEKARVSDESADPESNAFQRGGYANQASVYRMVPPLDELATYSTSSPSSSTTSASTSTSTSTATDTTAKHPPPNKPRYAVRAALAQEHERELHRLSNEARSRRAGLPLSSTTALPSAASQSSPEVPIEAQARATKVKAPKRDFFGRPIAPTKASTCSDGAEEGSVAAGEGEGNRRRGRGKSNVPEGGRAITMKDLLGGF